MTYLPAPYESAPDDDLSAALGAGLTVTTAAITSWMLGTFSVNEFRHLADRGMDFDELSASELMVLFGWSAAVVLMVIGALMLIFRRGRGWVTTGAVVAIAATAIGQFQLDLSQRLPQWPLYWGGVVVLVAAMLPATGRWITRKPKTQPRLIGTVTTGGAPF